MTRLLRQNIPLQHFVPPPNSIACFPKDHLGRYPVRHWNGNFIDTTGTTTAGIQEAINELPSDGGTIYIAPGTFTVTAGASASKRVEILGSGWSTIIKASGTSMTYLLRFSTGARGSSVRNVQFQGSKTGVSGSIQRGVEINGSKDCIVEGCLFSGPNSTTGLNFGVDIVAAASGNAKILFNYFERLVSSSGNGSAVLIEYSDYNQVIGNIIDGSEFINADGAPGGAIFLSSQVGGQGCNYNRIEGNRIFDHKQAGLSINSTTYSQFQGNLGACDNNLIVDNQITGCSASGGGDASSGIAMVGNSNFNRFVGNRLHHNGHSSGGGFGLVISGSAGTAKTVTNATNASPIVITTSTAHGITNGQSVGVSGVTGNTAANGTFTAANVTATTLELQGSTGNGAYAGGGLIGLEGQPKIDEVPNYNQIIENHVNHNKDDGVRLKGPTNTFVKGNFCYENGQRTANTFRNIYITQLAATGPTGNNSIVEVNFAVGAQPAYQMEIGSGVTGTVLNGNHFPTAATGNLLDSGSSTIFGINERASTMELKSTVIASGSLPAAAAAQNGRILIEDNGAGDRNLVIYAGGERFRIDGGAAI